MRRITPAALGERATRINPHFILFVKQPPDNFFERQRRIGQFFALYAARHHRHMLPFGMIEADMEAFAAFFTLCQMLHQNAARDAARPIRPTGMPHTYTDQSWYLLGLPEIMLRRLRQAFPFERNDALIAPALCILPSVLRAYRDQK